MGEIVELTAPEGAGRIDAYLAMHLELSRSRVQAFIRDGCVRVEGNIVRPSHRLNGGEEIEVRIPPPPPSGLVAQDLPVDVLHMDDHLLVVNKAAGMVVHPGRGHPDGTLVNALLSVIRKEEGPGPGDPARPGIVHRLDRGTSGVMVVTRSVTAQGGLAEQFAAHTVQRRYLALVWGCPRDLSGTIDAPLARHPRDRLRFAVMERGRSAVTHYERLTTAEFRVPGAMGLMSLVACRLETGRTHQVRVHLGHLGHPIVGDPVYRRPLYPARKHLPSELRAVVGALEHPLLHAAELGFVHPVTGEQVQFTVAPPKHFGAVLTAVGIELRDYWQMS